MPTQESIVTMTKEYAEKILQTGIEYQRVMNEKFEIQKSLGLFNWDEVQTAAMKFLLQGKI